MADRDHNRSNNTGTGAKTLDRDEVQERSDRAGIAAEPQPPATENDESDSSDRTSFGDEAKVPPRRT